MESTLIALNLFGAIALLLFGLAQIKAGILRAFGSRLRDVLAAGTRTQPRAVFAGFAVTLALQSSTATALLVAAFAERKMVSTSKGQLVMLGANAGTAATVWIVSLHMSWLSPLALLVGYLLGRSKSNRTRGIGKALVGVGLLTLSLVLLNLASEPMRASPALASFIGVLDSAWIVAFGFAALIALLSSSSLAAVMMIASIAATGDLDAPLVIALVLGANVGGAVPPVLATLSSGADALRLTLANLSVRGGGALLLLALASSLLPQAPTWFSNIAEQPVQVHLLFNGALVFLAWPLASITARLFEQIVADAPVESKDGPRHLLPDDLDNPVMALANATREVLDVGDCVERMTKRTMEAFRRSDPEPLAPIAELEKQVDRRQQGVKIYLSELARNGLTFEDSRRSIAIIDYAINLEHIGDIIEKGLAPLVAKRAQSHLRFSEEGYAELMALFSLTLDNMRAAQTVFATGDFDLAQQLMVWKVDVRRMEKQSSQHHLDRLRDRQAESLSTSSLHLDILRDLKRINAHVVSVAHPILDESGVLAESRMRKAEATHPSIELLTIEVD